MTLFPLLLLSIVEIVAALGGPALGGIESFVEAMRRLDVQNVPCAVLDASCLSNPRHLALLHLRNYPAEHLFTTNFTARFASVNRWLDHLTLKSKIYERMTESQRGLLALVLRWAEGGTKGVLKLRRPFQFAAYLLRGQVEETVLKEISEERLTYVLQYGRSKEDPIVVEFLSPFVKSVSQCYSELDWLAPLDKEAKKMGLGSLRERVCSYSHTILEFLSKEAQAKETKMPRLETVLQPFLAYNPLLAFADPHLARIYKVAMAVDNAAHLELLSAMAPVSGIVSSNQLYTEYERYVFSARPRLSDAVWLRLCTGTDGQMVRLLDTVRGFTASLSSLANCRLMSFGMDGAMSLRERVQLVGTLIGEKFRGTFGRETEAALLILGRNEPAEALTRLHENPDLDVRLRLLYRIKDVGRHLLKTHGQDYSNLELLNGIVATVTAGMLLITDAEASQVLAQIVKCNLQDDDELRVFFRAIVDHSTTMTCASPLGDGALLSVDGVGGGSNAYLSLIHQILGFPVTIPTGISPFEIRKRNAHLLQLQTQDDSAYWELFALAILTAGTLAVKHVNAFWDAPTTASDYMKKMGEILCPNETFPELDGFSLVLNWHLLVPDHLARMDCSAYKDLVDQMCYGGIYSVSKRQVVIDRIVQKRPSSRSKDLSVLQTWSMHHLRVIEDAIDTNSPDLAVIMKNPATPHLLTIPLYGPIIRRILDHAYWRARYLALHFTPGAYEWSLLLELLDDYFQSLPLAERVFVLPKIVPDLQAHIAQHPALKKLERESVANFVGKAVIYGVPIHQWQIDSEAFREHLFRGITPPKTMDKDQIFKTAVLLGFGKDWAAIYTDRDALIHPLIEEPEEEPKEEL
ncbi:hypothetical protein PSACC_02696 [Paramicrosporidium saccamoebae]|uniref:Uncharacterized protein n=1 Tax=Paramicrosporidium saccamoebae TaxID=1246581 RepID=A0A2H9TID4_9FUNG|nr:hypothetical protein PSACC_02696 [Paramicrosporidium saccamoebae]